MVQRYAGNTSRFIYDKKERQKEVCYWVVFITILAIILMTVGAIGYYLGKITILSRMTSAAEAEMAEFSKFYSNNTVTYSPVSSSVISVDVSPTAEAQEGLPLPDPKVADGSFKTYMDYKSITDMHSAQYQLQQLCWTDTDGFRRYEHYYLIALGSAYTNMIGETFDVYISSSDKPKHCMVGEAKADKNTDETHRFIEENGNIVEFIIDKTVMDQNVLLRGDISSLGFQGSIIKIVRTEYEELKP